MALRAVGPTDVIYDWLAAHPAPAQWDALLAWIQAVAIDVEMASELGYTKGRRVVRIAHIPGACTRASFIVFDTPARAIHILELNDTKYEPKHR